MNSLENTNIQAKANADKVEISTTAKEMHQLSQFSVSRQERLEQIKLQVQNGTYRADSQETAQSIIDYYLND